VDITDGQHVAHPGINVEFALLSVYTYNVKNAIVGVSVSVSVCLHCMGQDSSRTQQHRSRVMVPDWLIAEVRGQGSTARFVTRAIV